MTIITGFHFEHSIRLSAVRLRVVHMTILPRSDGIGKTNKLKLIHEAQLKGEKRMQLKDGMQLAAPDVRVGMKKQLFHFVYIYLLK